MEVGRATALVVELSRLTRLELVVLGRTSRLVLVEGNDTLKLGSEEVVPICNNVLVDKDPETVVPKIVTETSLINVVSESDVPDRDVPLNPKVTLAPPPRFLLRHH